MNDEIVQALKDLGVPVNFQHYSGTEKTYITFFDYDEEDEGDSDDEQEINGYYLQVDVWSDEDYTNLIKQVKTAMKNAGYKFTNGQDLYENDTSTYHKALRFIKADFLF